HGPDDLPGALLPEWGVRRARNGDGGGGPARPPFGARERSCEADRGTLPVDRLPSAEGARGGVAPGAGPEIAGFPPGLRGPLLGAPELFGIRDEALRRGIDMGDLD